MARMGEFKVDGLKELQKELNRLDNVDLFVQSCAKELAARLLQKVIKRTPVGQYSPGSGKAGGTLRRGWTGGNKGNAGQYVQSLNIEKVGNSYVVEITNPVEYASYVEYGHRTANHKGWVSGHFMMTISEQEIQQAAPQILERKIEKFLRGVFT